MNYKILEAHCVFENDKLKEVAVLWADKEQVRATSITSEPNAGYETLGSGSEISPQLLQRAAGGGSYLDDKRKKKYFPGKRNWSK